MLSGSATFKRTQNSESSDKHSTEKNEYDMTSENKIILFTLEANSNNFKFRDDSNDKKLRNIERNKIKEFSINQRENKIHPELRRFREFQKAFHIRDSLVKKRGDKRRKDKSLIKD